MPAMPRQSLRLGVKSTSIDTSSRSKYFLKSSPTGASVASSINPSAFSAMPSSFAEHNIPNDSTPRSLAFLILKLPGNTAPITATGIFKSKRTFEAPQTIESNSSAATSTLQRRNLSASGCGSTETTCPTSTPLKSPATGSTASTSKPASVN